uniref:PH domain-containing protein n=1 Tax=Romanomermis culicivorax TaxID=13658 RepID=A0A915ICU7_ROMCU
MEGPLSKWTNVLEGWQYRWFVLDETAGILTYYTSKEKMTKGERRGCVRLKRRKEFKINEKSSKLKSNTEDNRLITSLSTVAPANRVHLHATIRSYSSSDEEESDEIFFDTLDTGHDTLNVKNDDV